MGMGMQLQHKYIYALIAAGLAGAAVYGYLQGPRLYAAHMLKNLGLEQSSNQFIQSACQEDMGSVALILDAGMDPNIQAVDEHQRGNKNKTTALICAASKSNIPLINLLLSRGATVDGTDQAKQTALIVAAGANTNGPSGPGSTVDMMTLLLDKGAKVNAVSDNGTALHSACRSGNVKNINFLLDHGASVELADGKGQMPLSVCLTRGYGRDDMPIDRLISKSVDLDATNQNGTTLLIQAINSGNLALIQKLLALGANPNTPDRNGELPIVVAGRNVEMLTALLDKGVDVNARSRRGSPLLMAIQSQSLPAVNLLLSRGADPRIADQMGNTPLHIAAQNPATAELIKLLITNGASPNAINMEGKTPLHVAATRGINNAVEVLIANGALVNARNAAGQTPLAAYRAVFSNVRRIPGTMGMVVADGMIVSQNGPQVEKTLLDHGGKM